MPDGSPPRRILQITDTHLLARPGARLLGVDTADSLDTVLQQALAEYLPDAVVASGDLAHDPEAAAYERFRDLVRQRFAGPLLCLPGNHDLTQPLQAVLGAEESLRLDGWEVLAVDSHGDHHEAARFDQAALAALQRRLAASRAEHLLVAVHHPPIEVGAVWLDRHRIACGAELLDLLAADGRVRGLVFGHVHQQVEARHRELVLLGTPSTCFQFAPGSTSFSIDRSASGLPGYRWLELHPDGGLGSELRRVSGYSMNIDNSDRS